MKRICLFSVFIAFLCLLIGCNPDTPVEPPAPTTGELLVRTSSNWRGGVSLTVYDSEANTVWSSDCELNEDVRVSLDPGSYRVVASFGDELQDWTVTIAAGQESRVDFHFVQRRDLNVTLSLSNGATSGEATVNVNGVSYSVSIGQNQSLSVLRAEHYEIEALYTDAENGKTYSSSLSIFDSNADEDVSITITIDEESVIEEPILRVFVQSDDSDLDNYVITGSIGGSNYQLSINAWTVITGLEAGSYTLTIDQVLDGFTYSGTGSFSLVAGETEEVRINLSSNKSDGGFDIDDDIVGNVEIRVEGVTVSYRSSSTLNASATWASDEQLTPVWRLRPAEGAYKIIGTDATLTYEFDATPEGVYVLSFDLMKGDEVAARQVWRINVFE